MPAMPSPPRLRKRPFEATAAASAADETDITGCAAIAYTSEDPAHPVEHMLDGCCGPGAPRWIRARPDTTEQIVIEFDFPQTIGPRLRGRGDDAPAYPGSTRGSLGRRRPIVPPNSGSGIQLQPRGSHLSARRTALQSPPGHPSPSHDCSKQERLRHGDADGAPSLRLEARASSLGRPLVAGRSKPVVVKATTD